MSIVLDHDHSTGITKYYHKDPSTGLITVNTRQDVGGILDNNKKLKASANSNWKGDLHHVASIPLNIINIWSIELKKMGRNKNPLAPENRGWLMEKLNNSEFSKLRTKEGAI